MSRGKVSNAEPSSSHLSNLPPSQEARHGSDQARVRNDFMDYQQLYRDVRKGDWKNTKRAIEEDAAAKTAGITYYRDTPLHLAVRSRASVVFVRNLVDMMSVSDLEILQVDNYTSLHRAATTGYTEAAKILVEKNPRLTQFRDLHDKTPVLCAAMFGHKDTASFLLTATRRYDPTLLTGQSGVLLLNMLIVAEFYGSDQVGIQGFIDYLQLYKDVIKGDWKNTKRTIDDDPTAKTAGITYYRDTPLHVAVSSRASVVFVRNLVDMMSVSDLEILQVNNYTSLHTAATTGYTEAAKILVEKNPRLTQFRSLYHDTPVHCAAKFGHKDTVRFLLTATRRYDPTPLIGQSGVLLLNWLIIAEFYDVAIFLLKCYPDLAIQQDQNGFTPLDRLARKPRTFLSGSQLGLLRRLLYKCVSVEKASVCGREDLENPKYDLCGPWKFGFLRDVYDTKLMHLQAVELAKMLCAESIKTRNSIEGGLSNTITAATRLGIQELVLEILRTYPDALWSWDIESERYIFHLAVQFRQEKVYNILHEMSLQNYVATYRDKFGNNILHIAGMLEPSNRISGAALQMQRELQWFKEVENAVQPTFKEVKNDDGKTPREVFTEQHRQLVVKGEEWMKNTASSCTVVAALITTVVFAAAFTLPGGNTSDGLPIFLNKLSFLIFAISNALALFSSSTSVLMFLGILTSRYSEEDFLRALPMRLCIGLVTLFLSIAFMLVAFSSSLHIVLVHRLNWVAAPIVLLACIPLTLFAFLQFPLLVEIVSSTFGPSIFHPQSKEIVHQ